MNYTAKLINDANDKELTTNVDANSWDEAVSKARTVAVSISEREGEAYRIVTVDDIIVFDDSHPESVAELVKEEPVEVELVKTVRKRRAKED